MSEDNLYLLSCYLVYALTLTVLVLRSKRRRRTAAINLVVLVAYSTPLLYGLNFRSEYGIGLVWLVYLMIALGVHWVANLIALGLASVRSRQDPR